MVFVLKQLALLDGDKLIIFQSGKVFSWVSAVCVHFKQAVLGSKETFSSALCTPPTL